MTYESDSSEGLRYKNVKIRFDNQSRLVSLNDLWLAGGNMQAMEPLAWVLREPTQDLLERLARDIGLPPERLKFWPRNGTTRKFIVMLDHVINVDDSNTFVSPELAILYAKRLSHDIYKWAVSELSDLSLEPDTVPEQIITAIKDASVQPLHIDLPPTHFDAISISGKHGDHDDHFDVNTND